ncbi:ATP-binding protein, partial [Prevotella sp. MGM1]
VQGFQDVPKTAAHRVAITKVGILLSIRQQEAFDE